MMGAGFPQYLRKTGAQDGHPGPARGTNPVRG